MTSKSLRRLASDHANLHKHGLPPNYLWPPNIDDSASDLTTLTLLLAGPEGTPFSSGLYTLTLSIPPTYPSQPPTARFSTKIFHPNVDPGSGAVCVETLKRDWKPELTLRDILVTVGCLLVFPNAASALNAEAGRLVQESWGDYERKAGLWARMHAAIPLSMREAVEEARRRGEEDGGAGPSQLAVEKRKRKERRVEPAGEDVFVREDSIQTTPPAVAVSMAAPPPQAKGLGLDLGIDLPGSSLHTEQEQYETPTQPPAPARRRKKAEPSSIDDEQIEPLPVPASFASTLPTPTPGLQRPLIHSNPSTPRLGRPEPKRRRLTPEDERIMEATPQPEPVQAESTKQIERQDDEPWLSWRDKSPFSSPEDQRVRKKRKEVEAVRMERVGGSLEKWNAGLFGPRMGVSRL